MEGPSLCKRVFSFVPLNSLAILSPPLAINHKSGVNRAQWRDTAADPRDSIPFSFLLREEGRAQVISDYERMPLSRYMRDRKGGKGAAPVSVPYIEGSAGPLRETPREGGKRRQGALREGTRASRRESGENKSPPHSASRRPFGRGRSVR